MTLSSDAASDGLWAAGAPVIRDCWNDGYSPASCMSSQPCSPGPAGGLLGHGEKFPGELASGLFAMQDSYYRCKRIRLHTETGASMQAYNSSLSAKATSAQLAFSLTPSQHVCTLDSLLRHSSSGVANLNSKTSSFCVGGGLPSSNGLGVQTAVPMRPDLASNFVLAGGSSSEMPLCNGASAGLGQLASVSSWLPQQHQQPLQLPQLPPMQELQQQLQQQLVQLVALQPALVCNANTLGNMAMSLVQPPPPPPPLPNISLTTAALRASGPERLQSCPARNDNSSGNNNVNSTAADLCVSSAIGGSLSLPFIFTGTSIGAAPAAAPTLAPTIARSLPSSLPSSSSLPASFLNSALAMSDAAAARMGSLAPVAAPGLPAGGAYAALSNAVGSTAVIAAAAASGLHAAMAQTATVHVQPRLLQAQQPSSVLVASQLQTPGYSSLREPVRCVAQLGAAGTRVAVRGHSDSQLQLQIIPQQPQQQPQQQQQRGKLRLSSQRRVRPPSPALPAMPSTPPQLGSLGPEDWILHVIKCLGMSEPDTARLSLHCWRRVSELPQLHHATRLWPSAPAGKKLYATACLWVSIKLEEKRRDAPGGVVLSHLAAATPGDLCAAELAVMNWLNWRPYDGYRLDESHLLVYM